MSIILNDKEEFHKKKKLHLIQMQQSKEGQSIIKNIMNETHHRESMRKIPTTIW